MSGRPRLRTLLALWLAYWAGLAASQLAPALWHYLRIRATAGTGTISWSFTGSATLLAAALVGPPLLIWVGWLALSARARRVGE